MCAQLRNSALFRLINEVRIVNAKRLTTPKEKVRELQEKLGFAAKVSKKRRIHALYDKVIGGCTTGSVKKGKNHIFSLSL